MVRCCMDNCKNSYTKGYRMFRFPSDCERRRVWLENCKRDFWDYKPSLRLCEEHFEDSQFENKRKDNLRKLKPNAVPTIFNPKIPVIKLKKKVKKIVSSSSPLKKHKHVKSLHKSSTIKKHTQKTDSHIISPLNSMNTNHQHHVYKSTSANTEKTKVVLEHIEASYSSDDSMTSSSVHSYHCPVKDESTQTLDDGLAEKEELIQKYQKNMSSFLTGIQVKALDQNWLNWDKETLIKCLKLRYALGKHGYEYLRKTGYPAPSTSTLNRQTKGWDVDLGVECIHFEPDE